MISETAFVQLNMDDNTVDGRNSANQLIGSFSTIYKVLKTKTGGAGFLPSTVPCLVRILLEQIKNDL